MQKHVNIEWSNSARKYENARRKNTCNRWYIKIGILSRGGVGGEQPSWNYNTMMQNAK